jgi:hypothetical protein
MSETTFTADVDGEDKVFEIKAVSLADQREAQKVYNQAFSDAVKSGSIVRARLDDLLKEQGLWDDNKQASFVALQKQISESEKALSKGGISLKEAKKIAINIKKLREDMRTLIAVKTELDSHTAEGQADNARFNFLVSVCVVYKDTKQRYFKSYEDYMNRSSELVAILGAQKTAYIMYGLDSNFEKNLPENKFLIKYKLVNEQLDYVDSRGRLTDEDGRLVDENGRFINEEGQFVDRNGNIVNNVGEPVVEFQPFLDEDGNPIIIDNKDENKENEEVATQSDESEPEEVQDKPKAGRPKKNSTPTT